MDPVNHVLPGIDVFCRNHRDLVKNVRVGLVTNLTATDASCVPTIDRLADDPDIRLTALFGPEHGIKGIAQAGISVGDDIDPRTGLPVYSLYGERKKPSAEMLAGVDVLMVDLPDIGCRYWTNLYTIAFVLEAAVENGKKVIVLDRPNPITGLAPEGNVVQPGFTSFVGGYPITNRTGLTIGEAARLFNDAFGIGADLHVIPVHGWRRSMWFDETGLPWVPPSPNMPSLDAALLYAGTCLIEGTNLSEGRGTTKPFEFIGAPWIDAYQLADNLNNQNLPGVVFRPVFFTPTFQKHQGKACGGVQVHVVNRSEIQPVRVGLHLLSTLYRHDRDAFEWYGQGERRFIDLLAGTDTLRADIEAGRPPDEIWSSWNESNLPYLAQRQEVLMYES